jgi:hypothetical protein
VQVSQHPVVRHDGHLMPGSAYRLMRCRTWHR